MSELQVYQALSIFFGVLLLAIVGFVLKGAMETTQDRVLALETVLRQWGLEQLARLMHAVGVRNWIGRNSVARVLRELVEELEQPGGVLKLVSRVAWRVVENHILRDPDERKRLTDLMARVPVTPAEVTPPPEPLTQKV